WAAVLPVFAQVPAFPPPPVTVPANPPVGGIASARRAQFQGSVPTQDPPGPQISLSLEDAIGRGLKNNLGVLVLDTETRVARAQAVRALTALVPTIVGSISETAQQLDLTTFGFRLPGVPSVLGPFAYSDARAYASLPLFDRAAIMNRQAALQSEKAATFSAQ